MNLKVNAIATLLEVTEKGVLNLDVQSSKELNVGYVYTKSEEIPGYNDRI